MSKTVWLKWDGVYNDAGSCNQPLLPLNVGADPIENPDQVKALKQRLNLLGFDCGELNNSINDATKRALFTFAGYCDHPDIGCSIMVPYQPLKTNNPCPSCGKTLELPFEWCREHQAKKSEAVPLAQTEFYDDQLIEKLMELEDEWGQDEEETSSEEGIFVRQYLSRSHMDRSGVVDLSVNVVTPLAVKIVSVPASFLRFKEFAAIELSIEGFDEVKSLLFRVYRNFDEQEDALGVAKEKLVYQEVLDAEAVKNLPGQGPAEDDNKGPHHPAKAHILREMIGGGMTGFFGNYIGKAFDLLHAPYRVVVWISNEETAFDEFMQEQDEPEDPLDESSAENHRHGVAGAHSTHALREVRVERERSLSDVEEVVIVEESAEPEFDETETVHDSSFVHTRPAQEAAGPREDWSALVKRNMRVNQEDFWTERNERGINLIGQPCPDHDLRFLERNKIQPEQFPVKFLNDPLGVYLDLRRRLDREGENFRYIELAEVLFNVDRHMNTIKRRLCCGQWAYVEQGLKQSIVTFIDETIMPALTRLLNDQCPYDRTMNFCNSFMFFFTFVVYKAVMRPELDFYDAFGLRNEAYAVRGEDAKVRYRRGHIDGNSSTRQTDIGEEYEASNDPSVFFTSAGNQRYDDVKAFLNEDLRNDKYASYKTNHPDLGRRQRRPAKRRLAEIGKIIMVPSYNPLDVNFFVKIRAVPMYMIGMFDLQYLTADGIRQSPEKFFEHDLFHVGRRNDVVSQWQTLYDRLCEAYEENGNWNDPDVEFGVYRSWQEKINEINGRIGEMGAVEIDVFGLGKNDQPDGDRRFTMEFLYFFLFHEPLTNKGNPVVAESGALLNRINFDIIGDVVKKVKEDFFGDYAYRSLTHLEPVMNQINTDQGGAPPAQAEPADDGEPEGDSEDSVDGDFNDYL